MALCQHPCKCSKGQDLLRMTYSQQLGSAPVQRSPHSYQRRNEQNKPTLLQRSCPGDQVSAYPPDPSDNVSKQGTHSSTSI